MNLNKQMSTKQSIIFVIVIAIVFFIVQQVVYGQTNSNGQILDELKKATKDMTPAQKELFYENIYEILAKLRNGSTLEEIQKEQQEKSKFTIDMFNNWNFTANRPNDDFMDRNNITMRK